MNEYYLKSHISPLAIECLNKTETFLHKWVSSSSPEVGQKSAEVLLSLSVQRGTLRHFLQFISSCLNSKTSVSGTSLSNGSERSLFQFLGIACNLTLS